MAKGKPTAAKKAGKPASSSSTSRTIPAAAAKPASSRPAAAAIPPPPRSPSPDPSREEDLSTAIAFESQREWEVVRAKLESQVREMAKEVCDVEGVADGPVRDEVERVMVDNFLAKTLSLMRPNITIDGRRPPPSLLAPPSPTSSTSFQHDKIQPYSEKLNDRVMRKQQVLLDASVGNARKRRVLPGHVVEMLGKAAKKEEEGWKKVQDAERGDGLARWKEGDIKLVHGSIPDAAAAEAEYAKASDAFDDMLRYVPDEAARAERASDVQLEVAKLSA